MSTSRLSFEIFSTEQPFFNRLKLVGRSKPQKLDIVPFHYCNWNWNWLTGEMDFQICFVRGREVYGAEGASALASCGVKDLMISTISMIM